MPSLWNVRGLYISDSALRKAARYEAYPGEKLISDAIGTEEESGYEFIGIHGSPKRVNTETRWNFLSVMSTRMALLRLACTKEEAFMTL